MKSNSHLYVSHPPSFSHPVAMWAYAVISKSAGQIAVVYFKTRSSSAVRRMVCVFAPNSTISKRRWDPSSRQLLMVFDAESGEYRFISMDAVTKIVVAGETHEPNESKIDKPATPSPTLAELKAELRTLFY